MTDLERAHNAEALLASATDLLNTWAREMHVQEAASPARIKYVIHDLWTRCAMLHGERDSLRWTMSREIGKRKI